VLVSEIRRFPIKSLLGERLDTVAVDGRGLAGDRLWAVRDADGKFGSGKNTRRFRRIPGLFDLRGRLIDSAHAEVELPDGRRYRDDDSAGHAAVSQHLGRDVTITREADVLHHDEGPVSVITTARLRHVSSLLGAPVEALRFRANLLIDADGREPVEDGWLERALSVGPDLILRVRRRLTRCVMIDMAQDEVPEHGRILRTLSEHNDLMFGVWATVERPGVVAVGDEARLLDGFPTDARR
jgi:hypothetical protein